MVLQRVGSRRHVEIVIEHCMRRNEFGQLNVAAILAEADLQRERRLGLQSFVSSQKLVGQCGASEIEKLLDVFIVADNTLALRAAAIAALHLGSIHTIYSTKRICDPCTSGPIEISWSPERAFRTASCRGGGAKKEEAASACAAQLAAVSASVDGQFVPLVNLTRRNRAGEVAFQPPTFVENLSKTLEITVAVGKYFLQLPGLFPHRDQRLKLLGGVLLLFA